MQQHFLDHGPCHLCRALAVDTGYQQAGDGEVASGRGHAVEQAIHHRGVAHLVVEEHRGIERQLQVPAITLAPGILQQLVGHPGEIFPIHQAQARQAQDLQEARKVAVLIDLPGARFRQRQAMLVGKGHEGCRADGAQQVDMQVGLGKTTQEVTQDRVLNHGRALL